MPDQRSGTAQKPFGTSADLAAEFPLLWEKAMEYDFAERLGGCTDPLLKEIDRAMYELWTVRENRREAS